MAQLTDDCFAFSGPLMPLADMEKLIVERVQPVSETETVSLNDGARPRHRGRHHLAAQPAAVR